MCKAYCIAFPQNASHMIDFHFNKENCLAKCFFFFLVLVSFRRQFKKNFTAADLLGIFSSAFEIEKLFFKKSLKPPRTNHDPEGVAFVCTKFSIVIHTTLGFNLFCNFFTISPDGNKFEEKSLPGQDFCFES